MDKLKVILVDNERLALDLLKITLSECGKTEIIGEFTKASKALEEIKNLKPDIAFLDIEMPGINGIELAMKITEIDDEIDIVFVTAYDFYALDAFRVNAIDYILKPVTVEAMNKTLNRFTKRRQKRETTSETDIMTEIKVFGEFSVVVGNACNSVRWTTAKVEELFAYLLINEGKLISKWGMMELLWPNSEPQKAEQNLYTTIFRLKKTLLDSGVKAKLHSNKGYYQLQLEHYVIDLNHFKTFINTKMSLSDETVEEFEKSALAYRGDLFGDKAYS